MQLPTCIKFMHLLLSSSDDCQGNFESKSKLAYSCNEIVCGWSISKADEKRVRCRISWTSEFRLCSAPSFWPEARWEQTKHTRDWKTDMLTVTDPCISDNLLSHLLSLTWAYVNNINKFSHIVNLLMNLW
jgi:hypothetical protein